MLALLRAHGFTKHLRTPGANSRMPASNSLLSPSGGHGDLRHRSDHVSAPQLVGGDVVLSAKVEQEDRRPHHLQRADVAASATTLILVARA
jgi:hypothetical protein